MRLFLTVLLIAATAMPALAESKRKRAKRCAAQAEIVGQAVEMRKEKTEEDKVIAALGDDADDALAPTVPILVGYVYSLADADLDQDIRGAFEEQCNGFKP